MTNPFTDVHDFPIRSSDGAHVHVAHAADGITLGVDHDAADDSKSGARTTLTPDEAITIALELLHCAADTLSPAELWDFGMYLDITAEGFVDAARDRGHRAKGWLHS